MNASVSTVSDIFTREELDFILELSDVQVAKEQVNKKTSGSVSFSIALTQQIRKTLLERLGLSFAENQSIPMRWIKGDTMPHIDSGAREFDTTHLVYLTDSDGEFQVGECTFPIVHGSAFVFSEGIRHETRNTGTQPRLLLGPMSDAGFAVGGIGIYGPGGTTVYIRQSGSDYQFSNDQTTWNTFSFPIVITNTDTSTGVLNAEFITDMAFESANAFFFCGSSHIQFGSSSLKTDGTRPIITIDGVTNYSGLIHNGDEFRNGYNNIYIYNLDVRSVNGSTLENFAGWIGQSYFGKAAEYNFIVNCCSSGAIGNSATTVCGGIVGAYVGSEAGASLTIIGCSSSGNIGVNSGGIAGPRAGSTSGRISCLSCWSTGDILGLESGTEGGGGIFGEYGGSNGNASATNCYSEGSIGRNGGGIYGRFAGLGSKSIAQNCYSRGMIGTNAGGIIGAYSGFNAGGGTSAINCYSAGTITTPGNGIHGSSKLNEIQTNCYAANGSWSSPTANTSLQGIPSPTIGTVWVFTGVNQPHELLNMGYTPYTVQNISATTSALVRTYSESVTVGNSAGAAIIQGKDYAILQIAGVDEASHSTITIDDSVTGVISTTASTAPGIYTLYVRNTGSYHITEFLLTVLEGTDPEPTETPCCARPVDTIGADYATQVDVKAGLAILLNFPYRRGTMTHSDVIRKNKIYAFKR